MHLVTVVVRVCPARLARRMLALVSQLLSAAVRSVDQCNLSSRCSEIQKPHVRGHRVSGPSVRVRYCASSL